MMFKGFKQSELVASNPLLLIAILSEELVRTNQALEALAEQLKRQDKSEK